MSTMLILDHCKPKLDEIMPGNDIHTYAIRQWALQGKIKSVMAGRRRLINFNSLIEFLENGEPDQPDEIGAIRKIRA